MYYEEHDERKREEEIIDVTPESEKEVEDTPNWNKPNGSGNNTGNGGDKKNNKNKFIAVIIAVAIIVAVIVVAGFMFKNYNLPGIDDQLKKTEKETYDSIGSTKTDKANEIGNSGSVVLSDVSQVVDNAMPSVVSITSTTFVEQSNSFNDEFFDYYFGNGNGNSGKGNQKQESVAAGSGIIVDQTKDELLIVTNNHVIEGADKVSVQFYGQKDKETVQGTVKGTDATADIAIVSVKINNIKANIRKNIRKASLGDSDKVKVGQGVIAIGNALGYGQSVTTGVISAKDREATIENKKMKLLQTDAAINGGNSGGALLNQNGEVIGINVAKYSSSGMSSQASIEGMGFAIPISSIKTAIKTLEKEESRQKQDEKAQGYLGIEGTTVDEQTAQTYSMPQGVYVRNVFKGEGADRAGIKKTDVITEFDGKAVDSMETLQSIMAYYKVGEKVKVKVSSHNGAKYESKTVTVTLSKQHATSESQTNSSENYSNGNNGGNFDDSFGDSFFGW